MPRVDRADFLDWEATQDRKNEYLAERPALQDYLLVDIDARRLERFSREPGGD